MCNIKHYIYLPLSYLGPPLNNLAFYVITGFILKTVTFAMSGWVYIDDENIYLLSASNGVISPACGIFLTHRPIYGLHATLLSFPQITLLKYFPHEGQLSMYVLSELIDA